MSGGAENRGGQGPGQPRLTKAQRRQASRDENAREVIRMGQYARQRRALLKWGGIATGLTAVGAVGYVANEIGLFTPKEKFTGEVEETQKLLGSWQEKVKRNPKEVGKTVESTVNLAIAYFAKQMGTNKDVLAKKVQLLSGANFKAKIEECSTLEEHGLTNGIVAPGFTKLATSTSYFDMDFFRDNVVVNEEFLNYVFSVVLHELHHVAPQKRVSVSSIQGKPISYERGVALWHKIEDQKENCYSRYNGDLEEAIVTDSTIRLLDRLGIQFLDDAFTYGEYKQKVILYRQKVLDRFFGGKNDEVLRFQQQSRPFELFKAIGQKLGKKTDSEQIDAGNEYVLSLFGD